MQLSGNHHFTARAYNLSSILSCIAFIESFKYTIPHNMIYKRTDILKELIQLQAFPVKTVLHILLKDKTTKKNMIWVSSIYEQFGEQYADDRQITTEALTGLNPIILHPRIMKAMEQKQLRVINENTEDKKPGLNGQSERFKEEADRNG